MERPNDERRTPFPPFLRPYYDPPLSVARAEGCRIWDDGGRSYLDGYAGVATLALGHCNETVDRAAAEQARRYGHVSALYRSDGTVAYAERLLGALDSKLDRVFFVNSGSEAVDMAIVLARATTGSQRVIALCDGYHGGTYLTKAATGLPTWHFPGPQAPDVTHVMTPKCHGCAEAGGCASPDRLPCVDALEASFSDARAAGERPIFLMEPVLGVGGVIVPPAPYFEGLKRLLQAYEGLLIADEVQTGFARCGERLFACQRFGLRPDLLCLGKGIANGYPLGAVAMSAEVARAAASWLHFNTFGGNPVSVAAAGATLALLQDGRIAAEVQSKGKEFLAGLGRRLADHPLVTDLRGVGFFIGVELATEAAAARALQGCYEGGLLVGLGGVGKNVLRLEPALVFTEEDCAAATAILAEALRNLG